jgi:hypothetical protein
VAGLLAHTRMKHKMRKERVNVQGCKFLLDPSAPPGAEQPGAGREEEGDDEEDEEPFSPPHRVEAQPQPQPQPQPQQQIGASVVWQPHGGSAGEPQSKKLKIVFKMKKEGP